MTTIDIRHAKRQLYRIWQWVAAGEQIVLRRIRAGGLPDRSRADPASSKDG